MASATGLSDKVSIITGASSGLGQATAILFARQGAKVTLCGRDQDRLKEVLDQCTQASGGHSDRFITVQGDVTDVKVREDIVARTVQTFGRLDVLVPNAGIVLLNDGIRNATEETYDAIMNVNVKSVFFLIQQALPHLEKTKGNIVSVSSVGSQLAVGPSLIYVTSKAAVDHMTRCLALDLGPKGIRVNAVNPSYVPTLLGRYNPAVDDQAKKEMVQRYQPTGDIATPEDVANTIAFLASDAAKFITGECLFVDGGRRYTGW